MPEIILANAKKIFGLCREISEEAHTGQVRWNNQPYFSHPERIANKFILEHEEKLVLEDYMMACVALLHDVIEDCEGWTADKLIESGVPQAIVWDTLILTKLKGERYLPYILRVKGAGSDIAKQVKIEDIKDNLSDLHVYDPSHKLIDRYQMALWILTH